MLVRIPLSCCCFCAELMGKDLRATVLSVDSLLKTLLEFALAPLAGCEATLHAEM